ncbi:MAG: hypothetical protein ACFFDB_16020 [Promethearchaeota archaeon]
MIIYFLSITYQILKRRRQRLNLIFASFFICAIIGGALNITYFLMTDFLMTNIILILNFLTNFSYLFSAIFILTVNRIILESTIIFSVKRQNIYILFYGIVLFVGMLVLVILGQIFDPYKPILGLAINPDGAPVWGFIFFIYVILFSAIFIVVPFIRTSVQIFKSFETISLEKKWLYYFIGSLGVFSIFYLIITGNLLDNINFKNIISIYSLTMLLWVSFMYYGIGFKLKT